MRNYGKLRDNRHALKNGQIKMFNPKRGYYFKKKEQKRDGHALRCKKYARFFDKEAGTFWGLPLDKPWFIGGLSDNAKLYIFDELGKADPELVKEIEAEMNKRNYK